MRKFLTYSLRTFLLIIAIPVAYFTAAFVLSFMTIDRAEPLPQPNHIIYLHSNGIHMDVAINQKDVAPALLKDINMRDDGEYVSFGWGDKNFYLNTPGWENVKMTSVMTALFVNSPSLMHLTHYAKPEEDWIAVPVSDAELANLNKFILQSFQTDNEGKKILIKGFSNGENDDFYEAKGGYNMFNTCNTWVNAGFKQSGLKASVWTPFDFGLMNKYE